MTDRQRVLLTDPIGGDPGVVRRMLEPQGLEVIVPLDGDWRSVCSQVDAVIVNLARVDRADVATMAACNVIARLGVGVDSVDVSAATARGIWVTNVPVYCVDEVAEHTLALILSLHRRLRMAQTDLSVGQWNQLAYRGLHRIAETTLGIVGLGKLGRALAERAEALGYRVIAHDPAGPALPPGSVRLTDLREVLETADIVSLHVPLNDATRNLIDAKALALMKQGSFLVNTSRGGLVDEMALVAALDRGHLAGAALDAFAEEPLPPTSPLNGRANLVLTPHIGFLSEESLVSLQEQAAGEVLRVLRGEAPKNPVNQIVRKQGNCP